MALETGLAGERLVALIGLEQDLFDLDALEHALAAKDRRQRSHERVEPRGADELAGGLGRIHVCARPCGRHQDAGRKTMS